MKKKFYAFLFFIFLFTWHLTAQQQTNFIPTEISYFIDKDNSCTPYNISNQTFTPTPEEFIVQSNNKTLWINIKFTPEKNISWASYTLDLGQEPIPLAKLYVKHGDNWHYYGQTGRKLKQDYLQIGYMRQAIIINEKDFEKEEVHNILLKITPSYGTAITFHLWNTGKYWKQLIFFTILHTILSSICVSIAFIAIIYGFIFINKLILIVSIISFTFCLMQLQLTGVGPAFIWNAISRKLTSPDLIYYSLERIIYIYIALFFHYIPKNKNTAKIKSSFYNEKKYNKLIFLTLIFIFADFIINIFIHSQQVSFFSFHICSILENLIFITITCIFIYSDKDKLPYNIAWWSIVFLFNITNHAFMLIRIFHKDKLISILNHDIYISNYAAFFIFITPILFTTAKRTRIKFKDLFNKLDFLEKGHKEAEVDRHFYINTINKLLEMNTMAMNAINMPELRFDTEGSKEIKNLIQYNLVKSEAFLNTTLCLRSKQEINESNINLKSFFMSCEKNIETVSNRKNIKINLQSTLTDEEYIRMNPYVLELIFANLANSVLKLTEKNTITDIFLTYNDDTLLYIIHNQTSSEEHKILKKLLLKYTDEEFSPEEIDTDTFDFEIVNKACKLYNGKLKVEFSSKGAKFSAFIKTKKLKSIQNSDIIQTESFYTPMLNKDKKPIPMKQPFSYFKNEDVSFFIAENNLTNIIYLKNLLQKYGTINTSSNGLEAWNILDENKILPDIIIAEYTLPLISGYELFKKCSLSHKLQNIPFIIILQSSDYDKVQELYAEGISACITKPFSSVDLFNTISSILSTTYKARHSVINQINKVVIQKQDSTKLPDDEEQNKTINSSSIFEKANLSPREKQIAILISVGKTDKEIAEELSISPATVATHNKNIFKKLSVHSRIELIKKVQ